MIDKEKITEKITRPIEVIKGIEEKLLREGFLPYNTQENKLSLYKNYYENKIQIAQTKEEKILYMCLRDILFNELSRYDDGR